MSSPTTLDKLDADVLETVLLTLNVESRKSLFPLATANRALYDATMPILHRHCLLDFSKERLAETTRRIESLLNDSTGVVPFIRFVTVKETGFRSYNDKETFDLEPLVQLLAKITNLLAFTFNLQEQIPIILLDALHTHHPSTHLHVRNWTRRSPSAPCGHPAEEALAVSPCLRSLHAHFITGIPDWDHRFNAFHRIVALAPNLESISLTSRAERGCVVYGFSSQEEYDARGREAEMFSVPKPVRKVIRSVTMDSLDADKLRELSTITDLSKLTSLQCTPSTEFLSLASGDDIVFRLNSLKTLDVTLEQHYWGEAALDELLSNFTTFLSSCGELESLSVALDATRPWRPLLSTMLLYHGPSLRSLSLHQVEFPDTARICLSPGDLTSIRDACPNLRTFALDINGTADHGSEGEYYAVLRTMTELRELKIHMDLDLSTHDHEQQLETYPVVGEDFAREVWTAIVRKDEKNQGGVIEGRLDELVLYTREPVREARRGYLAFWVVAEAEWTEKCLIVRRSDDCSEDVKVTMQPRKNDGGEEEL